MATYTVEWTPNPEVLADSFNVYLEYIEEDFRKMVGSTNATRLRVEGIAEGPDPFRFLIAPVLNGIEASIDYWFPTETYRASGISDLRVPANLSGFHCEQIGPVLLFRWDEVEDADKEFEVEIRMGTSWDEGLEVLRVPAKNTSMQSPWWATGAVVFWAKLVTRYFAYSALEASASLTIQEDPDFVEIAEVDEGLGSWGGTKTSVEVDGADLRPAEVPAWASDTRAWAGLTFPWWQPYVPDGEYTTAYVDAGAVVMERVEVNLGFSTSNVDPGWASIYGPIFTREVDGVHAVVGARTWLDEGQWSAGGLSATRGVRLEVYIRTTLDDPAGSPTWTAWRRWVPGAIYRYRAYQLKIIFRMLFPFIIPVLETCKHRRVRKNYKEEQQVTVSSTGGTTITFATPFTANPKVTVNAITAGIPVFATIVDGSISKTSCQVQLWDAGGIERTGFDVMVNIQGY